MGSFIRGKVRPTSESPLESTKQITEHLSSLSPISIMTVFQAYCSSIQDDATYRVVLTFPDSSVADQWWRAISDTPNIASFFTRINPQSYTHTPGSLNVLNFFTDARTQSFAPSFRGRFFMTLIDDRGGRGLPIVPSLNVANAISGNWFFIRSTADPTLYWYYNQSNQYNNVTISSTGRTRFRITAVQASTAGKVFIATDQITIEIERTNLSVNLDSVGDLVAGNNAHQFLFGDFKRNIGYSQVNGALNNVEDGSSGWTWELVE